MNIISYSDVENYLSFKQIYFKKEIANVNLKVIAEMDKVHYVGKVEIQRLNKTTISFSLTINEIDTVIYEYKSDLEFFEFIKNNFIPVPELVRKWLL